MRTTQLGSTGITVTELCFGASPIGSLPGLYSHPVDEDRGVATVEAVLRSPIRFIDTSNGYGTAGESERRIGAALRRPGGKPDDVVIASKVDPAPGDPDFSGDRVRRSFEESLERLGLDRLPLLHLHDAERIPFEEGVAPGGPLRALVDLKERGLVDAIGVASGPVPLIEQYLATGEFDVVLSHNRYTLLDRSAEAMYRSARERGIGVLNAAPYGGGILSQGPDAVPRYAYGQGSAAQVDAARAMAAACARHDVPLGAVALQFSLRSDLVDSTVVGMSSPSRLEETEALAATAVPDELWAELEALLPAAEHWLDPR
ncbi:aldo/keto reductase [Amnibacterium kyonggiense]|uniref:D-threo-aldose 1-dehydrogenase n=1 Tax=Amnibacterium kyonggiense TaxID=595671 RepID=A0A4R7FKL8_9MICO|nr:aldo/keto reductase [Amnibacterium kyonggiense]TDS76931.1 D-threo-aldose 1-dehydrogenase [Amnibacterium kyonggiense]